MRSRCATRAASSAMRDSWSSPRWTGAGRRTIGLRSGGWKAADVEAVAAVPHCARPGLRARPRRSRGEEGLRSRQDVRQGRRGAAVRRPEAGTGGLGCGALPAGRRKSRDRRLRAADRVRRRGGSARPRQRDRQDRDLGPGRARRAWPRSSSSSPRLPTSRRSRSRTPGQSVIRAGSWTCPRRSSTGQTGLGATPRRGLPRRSADISSGCGS